MYYVEFNWKLREPSQKSYFNCIYLADNKALSASMNLYSMMGTSGWSHNCCYTEYKGGAIFIEDQIEDCTLNSCRLTWNILSS